MYNIADGGYRGINFGGNGYNRVGVWERPRSERCKRVTGSRVDINRLWFHRRCIGALNISRGRGADRYRGGGTVVTAWGARNGLSTFFRSVWEGTARISGWSEHSVAVSIGEG